MIGGLQHGSLVRREEVQGALIMGKERATKGLWGGEGPRGKRHVP